MAKEIFIDRVPARYGMNASDYIKLTGVALGVTAIAFFGFKLYKVIKRKVDNNKETKQYKQEINKNNITLSNSDFVGMANGIEMALNQRWDDDEKRVYAELSKLRTADDWKQLIVTFGRRKRDKSPLSPTIEGGLKDWLIDALASSEIKKVNEILTRINVQL